MPPVHIYAALAIYAPSGIERTFTLPGANAPANESVRKMARSPRDQIFKQTDLCRLLRAYKAAGVPQPTVRITKEGDLIAIPGEASRDNANPLDQWMSSRADQTEGH
jgi:hypothetical protein